MLWAHCEAPISSAKQLRGARWGDYFVGRFWSGPNLGFNLISYPLLSFFSPWVVERLFLSLYLAGMGVTVPLFVRLSGRSAFPASFLILPMLFCHPVVMGFYSYIIGIPLLLLAFIIHWKMRRNSLLARVICQNVTGLALYGCHMLVYLLFLAVMAAGALIDTEYRRRFRARVVEFACGAVAPAGLMALFFFGRWQEGALKQSSALKIKILLRAAKDLTMLSMNTFSKVQIGTSLAYSAVLIGLLLVSLKGNVEGGGFFRRLSVLDRCLLASVSFVLIFYFAVPIQMGDMGQVKPRLPLVIVLLLLPLIRISSDIWIRKSGTAALAIAVGLCTLTNAWFLHRESNRVSAYMQGLNLVLKPRAVILGYNGDNNYRQVNTVQHTTSLYGIAHEYVDAGNYEAALGIFNIFFRQGFPAVPPLVLIEQCPWLIDWAKYPGIEYVFGWRLKARDRALLEPFFVPVAEFDELSVWERRGLQK